MGDGETHYSDLSGLTDDQISQLKIYSSKDGIVYPDFEGTIKYAKIRKAWQVSKWFFLKPVAEFMTGVVGHTEEEYNLEWEEPEV